MSHGRTTLPAPEPPAHLSPRARELWRHVVMREDHRGAAVAASPARLALIQAGLEALDRAEQARLQLAAEGLTVAPADGKGMPHPHPLVRVERDSRAQFMSAWSALRLAQ